VRPSVPNHARSARVLFTLVIVVALVWTAGPGQIIGTLRGAAPSLLFLSFFSMSLENVLRALNWSSLLRSVLRKRDIPVAQLTSHYLASAFVGTFIPSSVGTDLLRTIASQKALGGRMSDHAGAIVMLNAVSWFTSCSLGLIAIFALSMSSGVPAALHPVAGILGAIMIGALLLYLLLGWRRDFLVMTLGKLGPRWYRFRHSLRHFIHSVLIYTRPRSGLPQVIILASFSLLLQSAGFMFAAEALSVSLPLPVWVLLVPVAALANLLPMSVSGFGIGQVATAIVLQAFGVPLAEAAAVSTMIAAVGTAVRLVCGGVVLPISQDRLLGGAQ
jgi:uncharacterized protein (TIRG00374 family)